MTRLIPGTVTGLLGERAGLQRVTVDGHPAYVLTDLVGPVRVGDRVVVNTTAVDLGLGSGGWHVVHWNLDRNRWETPSGGRVVKVRYTSLQCDVGAAEEGAGATSLPSALGGLPVVVCDLHSQLAPVARTFTAVAPGRRLVYVMTDWAALPLALSDTVAALRDEGSVAASVSAGQAFGGDAEAVNVVSALAVARHRLGADAVVVAPGPGAVGTSSELGFGGLEVAWVIDASSRLGGRPVVAVRWSGVDERVRHRGISHHTRTVLELAGMEALVAVPRGSGPTEGWPGRHRGVEVDIPDHLLAHAAEGVSTMGRSSAEDPSPFRWSVAAGLVAAGLMSGDRPRA